MNVNVAGSQPGAAPAGEARGIIEALASVLGLAAYVYVIGGILVWIRLTAAHLPADVSVSILDDQFLFAVGLRAVLVGALVFAVVAAVSYHAGRRAVDRHRDEWHAVVTKGPLEAGGLSDEERAQSDVKSPVGDGAVRVAAGLNLIVLSAVLGLAIARFVELIFPTAWYAVVAFLAAAIGAGVWLARVDPLRGKGWGHVLATVFALLIALFAAAPIGVLVLASVAIARLSFVIARLPRPGSISALLRSPLPWVLLTIYTLVALAWMAIPPVSYTRAVVGTPSGDRVGGFLARTGDGVWLAVCQGLPNATSIDERTVLIPAADVRSTTLGGESYRVDEGDRPSLAALAFRAAGIGARPPTWFSPQLRETLATCGGQVTKGNAAAKLGAGVLTGPGPPHGVATGGEPPIQRTTPAPLARLARRYQPTIEVTTADRFWPVSVASVLQEQTPTTLLHKPRTTCLVQSGKPSTCPPLLTSLTPLGAAPGDYLDYPAGLTNDPTRQFQNFARGVGTPEAAIRNWLANPAALNPWASAQVYFYDGGVTQANPKHHIPGGLRALEYWFFYPYNYYPTVVAPRLMATSPLAGDIANTDLHEGDWEHVSVLLDRRTQKPRFLYMARHDVEGVALPWGEKGFDLDGEHPIVQASFGGHATYPNRCGEHPRAILRNAASDWVVCGSGRFAFPAATTPLVDLARASWACWPGHFGEATPQQIRQSRLPENDPRRAIAKYVVVAGPTSPLRQAENVGACQRR